MALLKGRSFSLGCACGLLRAGRGAGAAAPGYRHGHSPARTPGSVTRRTEPRGAHFTFRGAREGKRGASGLAVKGREPAALGPGPSRPGTRHGRFLLSLPAPPRRPLPWGKSKDELCFLGLGAPCRAPAVTGRFVEHLPGVGRGVCFTTVRKRETTESPSVQVVPIALGRIIFAF